MITNRQIAAMLFNIATLLDMAHDNLYRVRAYRRAARRVLALREPAAEIVARGEPLPLPGVGDRIRRKLAELILSGALSFYEELLDEQPAHLQALLRVEGLGPRLAERLHRDLGIASAADIIKAAREGRIRTVYGFGERRESALAASAAAVADGLSDVA